MMPDLLHFSFYYVIGIYITTTYLMAWSDPFCCLQYIFYTQLLTRSRWRATVSPLAAATDAACIHELNFLEWSDCLQAKMYHLAFDAEVQLKEMIISSRFVYLKQSKR